MGYGIRDDAPGGEEATPTGMAKGPSIMPVTHVCSDCGEGVYADPRVESSLAYAAACSSRGGCDHDFVPIPSDSTLNGYPEDFSRHGYPERRAYYDHRMAEFVAACMLRYPTKLEEVAQFCEGEYRRLMARADRERGGK